MHDNQMNLDNEVKTKKILREIFSWFMWIGGAVALALILNNTIIVNAKVISESMESTIMTGDRILGSRLSFFFSEPQRSDVIVFDWPDNPNELPFVKRIIGLPGEVVEIINGRIFIDGMLLDESDYLTEGMRGNYGPFSVPEDSFFVLGDNRRRSDDSRHWANPFVPREYILGKVVFRLFPNTGTIN